MKILEILVLCCHRGYVLIEMGDRLQINFCKSRLLNDDRMVNKQISVERQLTLER